MSFSVEDIRANREYFAAKLRAQRQITDVLAYARAEPSRADFLLLDVRDRESFAKGHIPGAVCVPLLELPALACRLPLNTELVTYCWNHT